jgi:hypothetical protein
MSLFFSWTKHKLIAAYIIMYCNVSHSEHHARSHEIDIDLGCDKEAFMSEYKNIFLTEMHCKLWHHSNDCVKTRYDLLCPASMSSAWDTVYPVFFACRKFCKKGKFVHFLFCGSYFLRFKTIYGAFYGTQYEYNFYVFYIFRELKMVAKNAKIRLPRKNPDIRYSRSSNYNVSQNVWRS